MRLDELLVKCKAFASRSRARDAIERGCVTYGGKVITKPGQKVAEDSVFEIDDPAQHMVSRAGLKLQKALEHFAIDVTGKICLDIGISTGGFTQILLERGAAHVIGVDVGHGQLHPSLCHEERITLHEGLNAKNLAIKHLEPYQPQLLVCDVSFISLKTALPSALNLMPIPAQAILLIKPQFEAGRAALDRRGIVKDRQKGVQIAQEVVAWLETIPHWRCQGLLPAPIMGGDGNQEFLAYALKKGRMCDATR